jgi:hypothetical protein
MLLHVVCTNRDCVVVVATGHGLGVREVEVRVIVGSRFFSSSRRPHQFWGPVGTGGSFPRVKAAGA